MKETARALSESLDVTGKVAQLLQTRTRLAVERYGKRCKIYLVHFGGGVSGHIKLVPRFLKWVEEGYKVYTDTSWAVGFGARWLLTESRWTRRWSA